MSAQTVVIDLDERLTEEWFAMKFGRVQKRLRDANEAQRPVVLNLGGVTWISALSALGIATEIARLAGTTTGSKIRLRFDENRMDGLRRVHQQRTRTYLWEHGFIGALLRLPAGRVDIEIQEVHNGGETGIHNVRVLSRERLDSLFPRNAVDRLEYGARPLISATLISSADFEQEISNLVEGINDDLFRQSLVRRSVRDNTLQRLRVAITELVRNSIEHAYREPNGHRGVVGLYARILANDLGEDTYWKRIDQGERPDFKIRVDVPAHEWIELYVVDVGQGILCDAEEWALNPSLGDSLRTEVVAGMTSKKAQLELMRLLFKRPVSRIDRSTVSSEGATRGQVTGLRFLDKVLGYSNDRSCVFSGTAQVWDFHPFNVENLGRQRQKAKSDFYLGTAFRVSLNLDRDVVLPEHWFVPSRFPQVSAEIGKSSQSWRSADEKNTHFHDFRGGKKSWDSRKNSQINTFDLIQSIPKDPRRLTILRLPRNLDKNRLSTLVDTWIRSNLESSIQQTEPALVLADLSRAQSLNLSQSWLSEGASEVATIRWFPRHNPQPLRVYILSEDLCALAIRIVFVQAKHHYHSAVYSLENIPDSLLQTPWNKNPTAVTVVEELSRVVSSLRRSDSLEFWARIEAIDKVVTTANRGNTILLRGPVRWGNGAILPQYLDYLAAMQDRPLARIVRRSLRRLIALFVAEEIIEVDGLIESELRDSVRWLSEAGRIVTAQESKVLTQVGLDEEGAAPYLLLGSVAISFDSMKRRLGVLRLRPVAVIHVFAQTEPPKHAFPILSALEWLPVSQPESSNGSYLYEQVPGTPFIRRLESDGESVLSFADSGAPGGSLPPNDMYRALHRDGLLKAGHWSYGSHHSLLEADIGRAVRGFTTEQQNESETENLFPWLDRALRDWLGTEPKSGRIVIYPFNRLASQVIRVLKERATHSEDFVNSIAFVPVHLIPGTGGGISRLADISLSNLEDYIGRDHQADGKQARTSPKRVAIFDVGFITKRSLRYIRRQLKLLGEFDVCAFGLLNRSNSPAFVEEEAGRRVRALWRWNVPILGGYHECEMCSADRALGALEQHVSTISPRLQEGLRRVRELWRPADVETEWFDQGINPSPLTANHNTKLGFREVTTDVGKDLANQAAGVTREWHLVNHSVSTTLIAHYIELARYTSKSRLLIDKIDQLPFTLPGRIEAIAVFLLLCGESLGVYDRKEYLAELMIACTKLEELNRARYQGGAEAETIDRYLGLATYALVRSKTQDRMLLRDAFVKALTLMTTADYGKRAAFSSTFRVFMGVYLDGLLLSSWPDERILQWLGIESSEDKTAADAEQEGRIIDVVREFTVDEWAPSRTWVYAADVLGRGEGHGGVVGNLLLAANRKKNNMPHYELRMALELMGELLSKSGDFNKPVGILNAADLVAKLELMLLDMRTAHQSQLSSILTESQRIFDELQATFQRCLIRCGRLSVQKSIETHLFPKIELDSSRLAGKSKETIIIAENDTWDNVRYCVFPTEIGVRVKDYIRNAREYGRKSALPGKFLGLAPGQFTYWIEVAFNDRGLTLGIENLKRELTGGITRDSEELLPKHLIAIGIRARKSEQPCEMGMLYRVDVFLPWVDRL